MARQQLVASAGEVNDPQTKNLDDGVRNGDPQASSKASVMGSSIECIKAKKIANKSCGQVNAAQQDQSRKTYLMCQVWHTRHSCRSCDWCGCAPADLSMATTSCSRLSIDSPANVSYVSCFPVSGFCDLSCCAPPHLRQFSAFGSPVKSTSATITWKSVKGAPT